MFSCVDIIQEYFREACSSCDDLQLSLNVNNADVTAERSRMVYISMRPIQHFVDFAHRQL